MLRESSMPYSSLPQEEDGGQSYVTTRTAGEAHARNSKGRILSITVAILITCGLPLLIIAPLALTRANGRSDTSVTEVVNLGIPNGGSQGSGDGDLTDNDHSGSISNKTTPPSLVVVENTPPKVVTAAPPVTAEAKPTTTTTTTTTTPTPTTTTTTTTTTEPPRTEQPIVIRPINPTLKPSEEVPAEEGSGEVQTTVMPQPPEKAGGSEGGDSHEGDQSVFSSPPTKNFTSMVNSLLVQHEWWTLVALAMTAALAISTVIAALAWIIHRRLSSRRRRTNLQKVITDLQSRDKVILLNSEDSEDEA